MEEVVSSDAFVEPRIAVYAGTFDPVHNGHIGIVNRGVEIFDKVIVGVAKITGKNSLFSLEKRVELIKEYFDSSPIADKVIVEPFYGLLVEFAKEKNAIAIIRGLRAISDFDYEFQMALMNRKLNNEVQSIFLMPDFKWLYVSSTNLKSVASLGGEISDLTPPNVCRALNEAYGIDFNCCKRENS